MDPVKAKPADAPGIQAGDTVTVTTGWRDHIDATVDRVHGAGNTLDLSAEYRGQEVKLCGCLRDDTGTLPDSWRPKVS